MKIAKSILFTNMNQNFEIWQLSLVMQMAVSALIIYEDVHCTSVVQVVGSKDTLPLSAKV